MFSLFKTAEQIQYEEGQEDGAKATEIERAFHATGVLSPTIVRSEEYRLGYENGIRNQSTNQSSNENPSSDAGSGHDCDSSCSVTQEEEPGDDEYYDDEEEEEDEDDEDGWDESEGADVEEGDDEDPQESQEQDSTVVESVRADQQSESGGGLGGVLALLAVGLLVAVVGSNRR